MSSDSCYSPNDKRFTNFVCDCCKTPGTTIFCVYAFGFYGILLALLIIGIIIYSVKLFRG